MLESPFFVYSQESPPTFIERVLDRLERVVDWIARTLQTGMVGW